MDNLIKEVDKNLLALFGDVMDTALKDKNIQDDETELINSFKDDINELQKNLSAKLEIRSPKREIIMLIETSLRELQVNGMVIAKRNGVISDAQSALLVKLQDFIDGKILENLFINYD